MDFKTVSDDFLVTTILQTQMKIPRSRENVLHFFDALKKAFPEMTVFYQREPGEFVLESDRKTGSYMVCGIASNRITTMSYNPENLEASNALNKWVLEKCPFYFGISEIDIHSLDVAFGFNFDYRGNRNQVISDALLHDSDLGALGDDWDLAKPVEFEPRITYSLDDDGFRYAILDIESCCDQYQVRTGKYDDEPIAISFAVRQYPKPGELMNILDSYSYQLQIGELLCIKNIIPRIVMQISQTIATKG